MSINFTTDTKGNVHLGNFVNGAAFTQIYNQFSDMLAAALPITNYFWIGREDGYLQLHWRPDIPTEPITGQVGESYNLTLVSLSNQARFAMQLCQPIDNRQTHKFNTSLNDETVVNSTSNMFRTDVFDEFWLTLNNRSIGIYGHLSTNIPNNHYFRYQCYLDNFDTNFQYPHGCIDLYRYIYGANNVTLRGLKPNGVDVTTQVSVRLDPASVSCSSGTVPSEDRWANQLIIEEDDGSQFADLGICPNLLKVQALSGSIIIGEKYNVLNTDGGNSILDGDSVTFICVSEGPNFYILMRIQDVSIS